MKNPSEEISRRKLLRRGAAASLSVAVPASTDIASGNQIVVDGEKIAPRKFQLGLVTEGVAADWSLEQLLREYERFGFHAAGVVPDEAHGISLENTADARRQVFERTTNKTFVDLYSVETPCTLDFSSPEASAANVALAAEYAQLAFEINAEGIVVAAGPVGEARRISGDEEKRAAEILEAMAEAAAVYEREVWLEMSGDSKDLPALLSRLLERSGHGSAGIAWSCRIADVRDNSIAEEFARLRDHIRCVYLGELWTAYPYDELFRLLRQAEYGGYTLAKIPATSDPESVLRYYRRLWESLSESAI